MISSEQELVVQLLNRPWTFGEIMKLDETLDELLSNYDYSLSYLVESTGMFPQILEAFKTNFVKEIRPMILQHLETATVVMQAESKEETPEVEDPLEEQFKEGMKSLTKEELKEQIRKDTKQVN